jgi:hypothetical protein
LEVQVASADSKELHGKINKVSVDVAYIRGQLDEKLPHLASKDYVHMAVAEHHAQCKSEKSQRRKAIGKPLGIVGAVVALTGAVYALIEVLKGLV